MPYQNAAEVKIINDGNQDITVAMQVETGNWTWTDDSMYFHSNYRPGEEYRNINVGRDYTYASIVGEGVYVGDTLQVQTTDGSRKWWGEGDEKIFVDGEVFPSQFGSGTEDYYGYAWGGRHPETFNHAFVTQPDGGANRGTGTTVNGRVRALDTIPFNQSLLLDMEILNNTGGDYEFSVATMWYGKPGAFAISHLPYGDMNGDGDVNNQDIMAFAMGLFMRSGYDVMFPALDPDGLGDFNGDGVMNNRDIAGFATALGF